MKNLDDALRKNMPTSVTTCLKTNNDGNKSVCKKNTSLYKKQNKNIKIMSNKTTY